MVTYCVHWTDSVGAKLHCEDVSGNESHTTTRTRALREAKKRMDAGETPLPGTELWMDKHVEDFASMVAEETVSSTWQSSFADFVIECVEAP